MKATVGLIVKILAVCLLSLGFSLLSWKHEISSPASLLWMFGIPIAAAFIFKRRLVDRLALATLLSIASIVGIGLAAAFIGYP